MRPLACEFALAAVSMASFAWGASVGASPEIVTAEAIYRLDRRTGGVAEIIRKTDGATVVKHVRNAYLVKSRDGDRSADECGDAVVSCDVCDGEASFVCTNAALQNFRIGKRYFTVNGVLGRRLSFSNDSSRIAFVMPFTDCVFDPAFYDDAYLLGAGYIGPLMPAPKVKHPVREDTFVQTSKGMVLLNTRHPERGGFANLRVRVAGNPVLPWWQSSINTYREKEDRLWYLPGGWRMCLGTLDAPSGGGIVYEDRLAFFLGDEFRFFDEIYGRDPAMREIYDSLGPVDSRMDDVLLTYSWGFEPFTKYVAAMTESGYFISKSMLSSNWADYRWQNGFIGQAGGWIEGSEARAFIQGLKAISPRSLHGVYGILIAADPRSRVFGEHPEWFRTCGRNGLKQVHFPGLLDNYQSMINKSDCREFLVRSACDNAALIGADYVYTDEAQQENTINWQQGELVRDDHWIALWGDMRRRARADGRFLFFNGSGNPFADINYMECSPRQANPSNWREFAGVVYGIELASRLRPDGRMAMINYGDDFVHYVSHPLSVGWIPIPLHTNLKPGSWLSHFRTVRELGKTLPLPAKYEPDWKHDPQTPIESYAVRRHHTDDVVVSFINRSGRVADVPAAVDLGSLGFDTCGEITVRARRVWYQASARERLEILSDAELRAEYARTGEDLDLVFEGGRTVYQGAPSGLLRHLFENVAVNGTVQLSVTPGHAAIAAVNGLPTHAFYTSQKGVAIRDGMVTSAVPCDIVFLAADGSMKRARTDAGAARLAELEARAEPFAVVRKRPGRVSAVRYEKYPRIPEKCRVKGCAVEKFGIKAFAFARYVGAHTNLRNLQPELEPVVAEADAESLILTAGTTRRNDTLDTSAYAGLLLKGAESVRLRLTNTFWNASSVHPAGQHVWGGGTPKIDFAGLVVDYRGKGGKYIKRVDFSFGLSGGQLENRFPPWGTGRKQDLHFAFDDMLTTPSRTFTLDLAAYAPEGWNGEAFLSLGVTHILANRRISATIVGANEKGAQDVLKPRSIRTGVASGRVPDPVALPTLKKRPTVTVDGWSGKSGWGAIAGMNPFATDDCSADSSGAVAVDGRFVYVDAFAAETEKDGPKTDGESIFQNDTFEVFFRTDDGEALQVIADAAGGVEIYPQGSFPADKVEVHPYVRPGKGWGVALAVPYAALRGFDGAPGSRIGFNLCRSRKIRRGERSCWAPVRRGHGSYRDYERYGTLTVGRLVPGMGRWEEFAPKETSGH